ncbi:MAG: lysylphosphatidylglycerol synthase domain-containing protein [Gemmatimonadales bacterium]
MVAVLAVEQLVSAGGGWNVLGITRLLYPLSQAGVIAVTDADEGFIHGLPDAKFYAYAHDSVSWGLVLLAALLFLVVWTLKSLQFHVLARFTGSGGAYGQHARAYLYGRGINRIMPFDVGKVAAASALEGQGVPLERGAQIVWLAGLFIVFETVTYALYGLVSVGLNKWLSMMAWPLIILAGSYIFVRARKGEGAGARGWFRNARQGIRAVNTQPGLLIRLAVLSLLAFFLIEVAAYVISQAFTGSYVVINVAFKIVMMGVVGGYIARLIQITPGGIGQWEWGFATAVYAGGLGMPEAVSLAILVTLVRYITGGVLMTGILLSRGVETTLPAVLDTYNRPAPAKGS